MLPTTGQPTTVLLVAGTSDIATAIASTLASTHPVRLVIAARPSNHRSAVVDELRGQGTAVEVVDFDATDPARASRNLGALFSRTRIDVVVIAQGQLPDQGRLETDPTAAVDICTVNYTSAVVVGLQVADNLRDQGHGVIVALSSVAAVRPRRDNYVYGSTKAGMDAFYTGLRDRLRGSGVRVLVVRPGFVRSRMTAGLTPAPFAVTSQDVANAVLKAVPDGNGTVWVPAVLGPIMWLVQMLPGPVFRRLRR